MSSTECEVKQFLSETVATHPQYWSRVVRVSSTNPIPYASDAMQMRTELGLLKRHVLPATNTAGALQQFQTEIASPRIRSNSLGS
jgi:hypothetical protein